MTIALLSLAGCVGATILVAGAGAINDQVGFSNPAATTTADKADVAKLTGSGTIGAAGDNTSGGELVN